MRIAIAVALAALLALPAVGQDVVRFRATGLTCALCSKAIHSSIKAGGQAEKVEPNLQTQQWRVTYPKGKFDRARLVSQVESAGFSVAEIWLNDSLVYRRQEKRPRK
jgi:copper chaperone CopZ